MDIRLALTAISPVLLLVSLHAFADQKIKTKSNIKNDRVSSTCTHRCEEAGRAWAADNRITAAADCESRSVAFTEGCKAHLKQKPATESVVE